MSMALTGKSLFHQLIQNVIVPPIQSPFTDEQYTLLCDTFDPLSMSDNWMCTVLCVNLSVIHFHNNFCPDFGSIKI